MLKMANFPFPASSLTSAQKDSSKGASTDKKKIVTLGSYSNLPIELFKIPP